MKSMRKRLFGLKEVAKNRLLDQFFDDRMEAKDLRKKLNPRTESGQEIYNFVVTYGPDHRLFKA
jgi:hypothetical protein